MGICRHFESGLSGADLSQDEILTMDPNDITDFLHASAGLVGTEVTSPWFYLQLGLILAAAGIGLAADTEIGRAHV